MRQSQKNSPTASSISLFFARTSSGMQNPDSVLSAIGLDECRRQEFVCKSDLHKLF